MLINGWDRARARKRLDEKGEISRISRITLLISLIECDLAILHLPFADSFANRLPVCWLFTPPTTPLSPMKYFEMVKKKQTTDRVHEMYHFIYTPHIYQIVMQPLHVEKLGKWQIRTNDNYVY